MYHKVPLEYPSSTPFSSPVRTSVGAHPDVLEVGATAVPAADDVDCAGDVDHGGVPMSGSPQRAGGARGPRRTCGTDGRTTDDQRKTHTCPCTHARARDELHPHTLCRTVPAHVPKAVILCLERCMCVHAHAWGLRWRRHISTCECECEKEREKYRRRSVCIRVRARVRVRCDEQKMYTCTDVYVHMHLERCARNHICAHNMSQERARKRKTVIGPNCIACVCVCARLVCVFECVVACRCVQTGYAWF